MNYIFALSYLIYSHVYTLFFLQAAFLTLGGFMVWKFCEYERLNVYFAWFFFLIYWLHPEWLNGDKYDFRPDAALIPCFFAMIIMMKANKYKCFILFILIILGLKGSFSLILIGLSLGIMLQKKWKYGLTLFTISAI